MIYISNDIYLCGQTKRLIINDIYAIDFSILSNVYNIYFHYCQENKMSLDFSSVVDES